MKQAEKLLHEYKDKRFKMDKFFYANLLAYHIALGNEEDFNNVLAQLKHESMLRFSVVRNQLFDGYARFRRWDEILHEYDISKQGGRISSPIYGYALEAAANQGNVQLLDQIFYEAEQNKVFKTTDMYNALIKGYSRGGEFDRAWKTFEKLARATNKSKPNSRSYSAILTACGFAHQAEKIDAVLRLMNEMGFKPNSSINASIIAAYAKNRDLGRAVQALMDMQERGITWDARHKNALVLNLKVGDYPEALSENVSRLATSTSTSRGPLEGEDLTEFQRLIKGLRA